MGWLSGWRLLRRSAPAPRVAVGVRLVPAMLAAGGMLAAARLHGRLDPIHRSIPAAADCRWSLRAGRRADRTGLPPCPLAAPLSAPEQIRRAAPTHCRARAVRAEQALAHLLELGIGGVGIVEDALHVRIDARLGPRPLDHHGNAEPDRIGGAALAFGGHHEFRLDAESDLLGAEIDGAGAGHLAPAGRPD